MRTHRNSGDGRVERRCSVNFQCRGVQLLWMIVGQGPIVLAVGAGGGCLDIFLSSIFSLFFSLSLGDGPKYCFKGPFNQNNQPTSQK